MEFKLYVNIPVGRKLLTRRKMGRDSPDAWAVTETRALKLPGVTPTSWASKLGLFSLYINYNRNRLNEPTKCETCKLQYPRQYLNHFVTELRHRPQRAKVDQRRAEKPCDTMMRMLMMRPPLTSKCSSSKKVFSGVVTYHSAHEIPIHDNIISTRPLFQDP